jgi:hypothetical protein
MGNSPMPNGFENFASNAIALGERWRQQRQTKKLAAAMGQFDTDPAAAVKGITAVDPVMGYNMRRQIKGDALAEQEAHRTAATETLKTVTGLLRPAAEMPGATPDTIGKAYDALTPMLANGLGMSAPEIAQWRQMVTSNPSILQDLDNKLQVVPPGAAVTRGGHEVYRNAMSPKTLMVRRGDGGTDVITIDPSTGQPVATGPGGVTAPAATASGGPATADQAWAFTRPHEGGYAPRDANGAPVNFGINQAAHPEVDVRNITEDQAKGIFTREYFQKSGADKLPGPLGVMHADTFYINPKRAQEFLQQSGGDPQKYLQLRQAWQQRLVATNPKKYGRYANAWNDRNADLANVITGAAPAASGGSGVKPIYSTPGKPAKAGGAAAHILTADEVQAAGLNPNVRWQINHLGDYVMVGPAAQLSRANTQKQQIFGSIQDKTQRMKDAVDELLRDPGLDRAAGFNSYFPTVHGGEAANFEAKLDALKSQIGFSVLQDMRQMSPTGGALGNVSNYENKILQNSLNSLDLAQSPAQLRRNLQSIRTYADKLESRYKRAYSIDFSKPPSGGGQQGGTAVPPKEAIDMLRSNPSPQRRQQFDQIFGNGAASKYVATKKNNFSEKMPIGVTTPYGTRL